MRILEIHQPCDFDPSGGEPTAVSAATRCRGCGCTVHDLSSMTGEEAIAFLDARKPGQCLSFERGEDERIVFADGPGRVVGRIARDARPMLVVASLLLAACDRGERTEVRPEGRAPADATASAAAPSAATATAATATAAAEQGAEAPPRAEALADVNAAATASGAAAPPASCVPPAHAAASRAGAKGTPHRKGPPIERLTGI